MAILAKKRSPGTNGSNLPPVCVVQIMGSDADGDLFARPMEWSGRGRSRGFCSCRARAIPPWAKANRILAKLTEFRAPTSLRGTPDPPHRGQPAAHPGAVPIP